MAFLSWNHVGVSYGTGYMQGDGRIGQVVSLVGNDLFAVNTDPTQRSFGLLAKDYQNGTMPGVYCNGGVLSTDQFEGTPVAGDDLKVSTNGFLTPEPVQANEHVIAQVISVDSGILKFKLLV